MPCTNNFRKDFNLFKKPKDNKFAYSAIKKVCILKPIFKNIMKIQKKFANY